MLVAVTSKGSNLSSLVAEKFGKTPFILVYDTKIKKYEFLRNPYSNLFGGAGIQTCQFLIEKNVDVVITHDIGENALRLLQSADIKVYVSARKKVEPAINDYIYGKLFELKTDKLNTENRKRYERKLCKRNKNIE